jgi:hypothetical protein
MVIPVHQRPLRIDRSVLRSYGALGERESVAAACRHGIAAIRLEGLSEAERPQLKVRHGFNAATLIPAAAPSEVHLALPCPYPGMLRS